MPEGSISSFWQAAGDSSYGVKRAKDGSLSKQIADIRVGICNVALRVSGCLALIPQLMQSCHHDIVEFLVLGRICPREQKLNLANRVICADLAQ